MPCNCSEERLDAEQIQRMCTDQATPACPLAAVCNPSDQKVSVETNGNGIVLLPPLKAVSFPTKGRGIIPIFQLRSRVALRKLVTYNDYHFLGWYCQRGGFFQGFQFFDHFIVFVPDRIEPFVVEEVALRYGL